MTLDSRALKAGGIAVVVALLVAFGISQALAVRADGNEADDRRAAMKVARSEVIGLTSVSAQTSAADIKKLVDRTTAEFRAEFEDQAEAFRKALKSADVASTGSVASAGIVSITGDKAEVLVAASSEVSNKTTKDAEQRNYRFRVNLIKKDDEWLVSGLEFVA